MREEKRLGTGQQPCRWRNEEPRWLSAPRNDEQLERVRKEFADRRQPLFAMVCDVGVRREVGRLVQAVHEQLGETDVLVNNAGTILVGPAENLNIESLEDAMQTHFWGPFCTNWAVADRMKERRFGRIVNLASIGGKVAFLHFEVSRTRNVIGGLDSNGDPNLLSELYRTSCIDKHGRCKKPCLDSKPR